MAIVYIELNDGEITDEDSADENNGGLVDNLSGNQLNAVAEAVLPDKRHINNCCKGSETVSNKGLQTDESNPDNKSNVGKCRATMIKNFRSLPLKKQTLPYDIYFNNLFTPYI